MTNDKGILMRALLTLLLTVTCAGAWGEEVTADEALLKARKFVNSRFGRKGGSPDVKSMGQVSGLYVFNIGSDGGFVIVSNDDRTTSILGYGDSGSIDPDNLPANLSAWLQGYADQIAWVKANVTDGTNEAHKVRTRSAEKATVRPLLTTKWDQGAPYNNLCPITDGEHCATGCVATAYAQVMNYTETVTHKNTTSATATAIPGYTTRNGKHTLSAIAAGTVINWGDMIADYSGDYTDAQATAVANMMLVCGCAVQMDYGPESGAYTKDVVTALKTYFGYEETTQLVNRSCYTYANWIDLIYNELSQRRPVVYAGQGTDVGHEFVCDGYMYDGGDLFHINWGWGGVSDGYFVLSVLNPDEQGIGGSASSSAFTLGQEAVIGIQKIGDEGTVLGVPTTAPNSLTINRIELSHSAIALGESVDVTVNVTNNSTTNAYDGEIYLSGLRCGGMFVISAGGTQNCVITFTPTEAKSYTLKARYYTGTTTTAASSCSASLTVKNQTPTSVTASNIDSESATIGWTNVGDATKWNLRSMPVAFITEDFNGSIRGWRLNRSSKDDTHGISDSPCVKFGNIGDNQWLISPQITFGGTYSFCAWKSGETAEDFSVLYSHDLRTFFYINGGDIEATTTPTEYTIDLSGLSGKGWLAIIHFDGTEGSYLYVDDATIEEPAGDWTVVSNLTANSYSLTGLTATPRYEVQVQAVNNDGGNWSESLLLTTSKNALTLLNNDSEAATKNVERIKQWNGIVASVTLEDRTLYKDGDWNTLCLPFALSAEQIADSQLAGADIRTLNEASFSAADGMLTLNFTPQSGEGAVSSIDAGKPYIIKWSKSANYVAYNGENAATCSDIVSPVFTGVTVSTATANIPTDYVDFIGTTSPVTLAANDRTVLYLGSGNKLYWPIADRKINACRAYFKLNKGLTAGTPDLDPDDGNGTPTSPVRAFSLNFGDNGESTGIIEAVANSSLFTLHSSLSEWYDMQGRKLSAPATKPGLYIHNGKKVAIK